MTCLSGGWFAGVASSARIAEEDARMTPWVILLIDGHANEGIIPRLIDHNPWTQSRIPMEVMRDGESVRRFQALQQ